VRSLTGSDAHGELSPVVVIGEQDQHAVGGRELQRTLGDQPQRVLDGSPGQELRSDLGRGLQPALAYLGLLEQPGVFHRDARRRGQCLQHHLVLRGELRGGALLGQVQIAEHLITHPHRRTEKAAHRRMVGWEPD
jgi:hypothetical protein